MKRRISKRRSPTPKPAATTGRRRSRAEREAAKRLMLLLKDGSDARAMKIKRVRQSVRSRSYENDLKLSVATERLAEDL